MCTVSWLHNREGYQLLCNRDERHTRKPAMAPHLQHQQGVRFIAPIDGDHGGTWIAVNQFGLTFCLLNRYVGCNCCRKEKTKVQSRGLLVMDLADCRSLTEAQSRIDHLELEKFQPFRLVVSAPAEPCLLFHWTGYDALLECNGEYAMPLVSSSSDPEGVQIYRKRLFEKIVAERGHIDIELLLAFHASHLPAPCAYSPCMHREDASTVSFSRITVAGDTVEFSYLPCAPCSHANVEPIAIALATGFTVKGGK